MIEILEVKEAPAEQLEAYRREQNWVTDVLTAHPIKILPRIIEVYEVRKESEKPDQLDFAGLEGAKNCLPVRMPTKQKANSSESYWRTQILELASEQWCNGENRQMKASSSQVTLQQKVGQKVMSLHVKKFDFPSYMELANWLACFNEKSLTPHP